MTRGPQMEFYKNGLFPLFHSILFEAVCGSPIRADGGEMEKGQKKIGKRCTAYQNNPYICGVHYKYSERKQTTKHT